MHHSRYIKNKGITKLVIKNNSKKDEKTFKWNVDYDGNEADIDLDIKDNKNKKHYNWKLDNDDLAKILNVPTVEKPIHQRLQDDFLLQDIENMKEREREELMMPLSLDMAPISEPKIKMIVLRDASFSPQTEKKSRKVYRKTPKPKTVRVRRLHHRRSSKTSRSSSKTSRSSSRKSRRSRKSSNRR